MRRSMRLAGGVCCALLLAVASIPVSAQPAMRTVADPKGRYTISFPKSWEVMSVNATPLAGQMMSQLANKNLFSVLLAMDPGASADRPTILMVMGMPLPRVVAPRTFGLISAESMQERLDGYMVIKEGTATIAKRPAFYRYFTMNAHGQEMYSVIVYFTVQKTGYMIIGATRNQPDTVRRSFGDISQILETFHPTGK